MDYQVSRVIKMVMIMKKLLEKIVEFRNKCDVLVAHNGDRFDFPTLNARLIYHGMNL